MATSGLLLGSGTLGDLAIQARPLFLTSLLECVQVQGYQIDYEDWHHDVHGLLPYSKLIHKDPELRQILQSLPYPKFIFTNADIKHAKTVLGILGIQDLFEVPLSSPVLQFLGLLTFNEESCMS